MQRDQVWGGTLPDSRPPRSAHTPPPPRSLPRMAFGHEGGCRARGRCSCPGCGMDGGHIACPGEGRGARGHLRACSSRGVYLTALAWFSLNLSHQALSGSLAHLPSSPLLKVSVPPGSSRVFHLQSRPVTAAPHPEV